MKLEETVPMSFGAGNRVGKYRIERELGRGGMGVVYLAEDTTLGRMVALKILRTSWSDDPEQFANRFRIEARAVAALNHPNIVRIHALDTVAGRLTIDMEYVESGSLAERLSMGRLPRHAAIRVGYDILQALSQCHSLGIVHRDVKPSNVLVDSRGHVRLTDFGLAKAMTEHVELVLRTGVSSSFFMGTPRYAPPEAWEGVQPSPSWDIYSVGMLLYEALSGSVPFDATNPLALMKQVTSSPVPPLDKKVPDISPEFAALIHDMLKTRPEDRPRDGQEALERLEKVPEFKTLGVADLSTFIKRRAPRKRKRVIRTASSNKRRTGIELAVLAMLVALGVVLLEWKQEPGERSDHYVPVAQAAVFRETLPTKSELLHLSKFSDPGAAQPLSVHLLEKGDSEQHWLLTRPQGSPPVVVAYCDSQLSVFTMEIAPDRSLKIEGQWAEYDVALGNVFRTGKLTGKGFWPSPDTPLTAALDYVCEDGSRWTWTATGTPQGALTDTLFLHGFEDSELLQPLLYNELLKRLPFWAGPMERLLPCVAGQRTEAAFLGGTRTDMQVDGTLDEAVWRDRYFGSGGRIGTITGRPGPRPPEMLVRWFGDGLLVGLRVQGRVSSSSELRMVLLPRFSVPAAVSDRWQAVYRDGEWSEHRLLRQGVEQPWDCRWEIAARDGGDGWECEMFIPFNNLEGVSLPSVGERWRLNCSVYEDSKDGRGMVPKVQWGFPDEDEVQHGAVIVFGPRPERVLKP